jgi:hypothetical protein
MDLLDRVAGKPSKATWVSKQTSHKNALNLQGKNPRAMSREGGDMGMERGGKRMVESSPLTAGCVIC